MGLQKSRRIGRVCSAIMMLLAVSGPALMKEEEKFTAKAMAKGLSAYKHKLSDNVQGKFDYIAILEIPKIALYQGLVAKDSKYNDIKYNIQILDISQMPTHKNTNLVLAAHNGSSAVSFFNDLDKLTIGDIIHLLYNQHKYTYIIDNIYEARKTGKVDIIRCKDSTAITLITCKKGDDTKQLVFIGYLIKKDDQIA